MWSKSLYRSRASSHFYETEYEIWADIGPVGNTEKKVGGPVMSNFEGSFFMFSGVNEIFFFQKYPSVKSCIKYLESKILFYLFVNFFLNFFGLKLCMIVYCSIGDTSLRDFYIMTL